MVLYGVVFCKQNVGFSNYGRTRRDGRSAAGAGMCVRVFFCKSLHCANNCQTCLNLGASPSCKSFPGGNNVVLLRASRAKIRHGYPRVNFCTMVTPPNANIFGNCWHNVNYYCIFLVVVGAFFKKSVKTAVKDDGWPPTRIKRMRSAWGRTNEFKNVILFVLAS